MKRIMARLLALGLIFMFIASAAAETADDLSYTMGEKLMKQLEAGSGFVGTLTLNATAVEGSEDEAFSTVKPIAMDWSYLKVRGDEDSANEARLLLTMDGDSAYQQGSAEISIQDGNVYWLSSLTGEDWYWLDGDAVETLMDDSELSASVPAVSKLMQMQGVLSGTGSFILSMAPYILSGNTDGMSDAMQQFITKIDFWMEGYRDTVQMTSQDDGTSTMEIEYRLPASAVKAQLKQFLVDLMNNETLLKELSSVMPKEQAALFLDPTLQPYYFYAVNELPLQGDLVIRRVVSFLGDTIELSVTMPLVDSVSGEAILQYDSKQSTEDMPYENTLTLTSENSSMELHYHTYDTITGTKVYQGTLKTQNKEEDTENFWASFDISTDTVTTKDLNGYETLNQSLKIDLTPVEIADAAEAAQYISFSKMELTLTMRVSSLSAKNSPTDMTLHVSLSGDDMPQMLDLEIAGTTTAPWEPEALDESQAIRYSEMSQEDVTALMSQIAVKGGLLFLPYVNLPQLSTELTD